jgi:hypothetical protein
MIRTQNLFLSLDVKLSSIIVLCVVVAVAVARYFGTCSCLVSALPIVGDRQKLESRISRSSSSSHSTNETKQKPSLLLDTVGTVDTSNSIKQDWSAASIGVPF